MADLKGRSKDMKDKVVGEGKEAYGKATDDKSKETEGKAQSLGAEIKEKARNLGDEVKDKFSRKDEKK
ncbi:TPA: CsbD family protein [Enterococcus faecium]